MLYVFHVDVGRMLTFEMSKALENVRSLKETIERHYGIPSNSIVLLVSGGGTLQDENRVCNYTAGTDTNPIYMFSNSVTSDVRHQPPWPSIDNDKDLKEQVEKCLELPATYATVVTRAALAQKMYELAKEEAKTCETLVHEQHLQQQGWAAVVANMEDMVNEFQEKVAKFNQRYEEHRQQYKDHMGILSSFDKDLKQLSEIPILPSLMDNAESRPFEAFEEMYATSTSSENAKIDDNQSTSAGSDNNDPVEGDAQSADKTIEVNTTGSANEAAVSENEKKIGISVLDWISQDKSQSTLKRLATDCLRGLEQFEYSAVQNLKDNVDRAVDCSTKEDMKEIKGLERRLCDLERKMYEVRKLVQDQNELAQSFQQNQQRASTLGDTSILPDLCASHRSQLVVILKNQRELNEIRRQCIKSKEELGNNLQLRLRHFVTPMQTKVREIDNSLLFYHTSLKRLQNYLGIIEQIHMAPSMYVSAVTEVVRRRMFSSSFLRWASDLSCRLMTIYNEEVMRRHDFASQFEGHFLNTLFPGMDDMPPTYAIQAPSIFDSSLPVLTKQDLQELVRFLPELAEKIQLPNMTSVINFFSSRSEDGNQSKSSGLQEFRAEMGDVITASGRSGNEEKTTDSVSKAQLPTKEGCESETDTEEFEKVGQSPIDRRRKLRSKVETCSLATSTEPLLQTSAGTLTEENLGTTRLEVETLKSILQNVYQLTQSSISYFRKQLSALKLESAARQTEFRRRLAAIKKCFADLEEEARNQERETIQRMTVDHELEMNDLRKSIHQKDDEIQSLRSDNVMMKASHIDTVSKYESEKNELNDKIDKMKEVVSTLQQQLADVDVDKMKAIHDAIEQLEHKHKTDIESLRCRYKLMTSMDRSPSDTSLEKIEKPDMIDIVSHEQMMAQAREDFNREKERAIKAALDEERQRWESVQTLKPQQSRSMASSPGTPTGSSDIFKRILDEKERQLDDLRDKETHLLKENQRYKETIQSLMDPELCSNQSNFKDRIETLEKEKQQLTKELEKQHNRSNTGGVSIQTCAKGDLVMFVYSATYEQYTIVQTAPVLYFLHADSYAAFNLSQLVPGAIPKVIHCVGTVVDKEYCHARKDENRYKVSRGTRFYRVKVKPVPSSSSSGTSTSSSTSKSFDQDKHSHKKEKSKLSELSRSSSTITDQSMTAGTPGLLIDSFAQTEQIISPLMEDSAIKSSTSRDMIDSGVAEQQKSSYKERNVSITDDEDMVYSASGSVDDGDQRQHRFRYESVCEEEHDNPSEPSQPDSINSNTTLMLLRAFLLLNDDE